MELACRSSLIAAAGALLVLLHSRGVLAAGPAPGPEASGSSKGAAEPAPAPGPAASGAAPAAGASSPAQGSRAPGPPPPTASQKAEEYFKNIQALKGIPADQVVPGMQFISASLGVDCEYCHVEHANEKDDKKEKQTARKMIAMNLAINRENFEGKQEVTCNSCHRGAARPVSVPSIAAEEPASATIPPRPQGPPPRARFSIDTSRRSEEPRRWRRSRAGSRGGS